MAKQKKFNPYCMRTIKRTKVNGVRIYLKAYQTKPQDLCGQPVPERIFFYQITSSDGGGVKCADKDNALLKYEQMIEFEKRQTMMQL